MTFYRPDPETLIIEIPSAMRYAPRWLLWCAIPNGTEKPKKMPFYTDGTPRRGELDTPEDLARLVGMDEAIAAFDTKQYTGIGFALGADESGLYWQGIDLDDIQKRPHLAALVNELPGYVEKSPSGTGYHAIGRGLAFPALGANKSGIEAYSHGRYFTVTGLAVGGNPEDDLTPFVQTFLLQKHQPGGTQAAVTATCPDSSIPEGSRNTTLTSLGGSMRRRGMALGAIRAALLETNRTQCSPPLSEAEVKGIASSVARYTPDEPVDAIAQGDAAAKAFQSATGMTFDEANRIPKYDIPTAARGATEPFPLTDLNAVTAWIEESAHVVYPAISQHATLALAAMCASRNYVTPFGDPCSLYLGVATRSMGETIYTHRCLYQAADDSGLRRMVRATRFTGPSQIYKTLISAPACLYLADDYGGVAAFAKRQPSGSQEHALSILSQVYSGRSLAIDSPEEVGLKQGMFSDSMPVIYSPALTILGLVGWDHLTTVLRASEMGRGATEQMLFALGHPEQGVPKNPHPSDTPAWLSAKMRAIRGVPGKGEFDLAAIFNGSPGLKPSPEIVRFAESLEPYYAPLDAVSEDPRVRTVLIAARGTLRRIAAILAIWRDHKAPVVDHLILSWTSSYVATRMADLVEQFELLHSEEGKSSAYDFVLTRITEARGDGISERELTHNCKPYRNLDKDHRSNLIQLMLGDGTIIEVDRVGKNGQRGRRLFADKFAKKIQ